MGVPTRVDVVGVPVDAVDVNEALARVDAWVSQGGMRGTILAVNPEKVVALQQDAQLRKVFGEAMLLLPDGIGVVAAVRLLHGLPVRRVPGADFMLALAKLAELRGWGVFVYGATEEVNKRACEELMRRCPDLRICGRSNGYVPDVEMDKLVDAINASGAQVLFVALGSPKQEVWMSRYLPRLKVSVCQGVGGTLDTLAGRVPRAPWIFRRTGFEWLFRLLREPWRWRRQTSLPRFAWQVVLKMMGVR